MVFQIIGTIILVVLAGLMYRFGGAAKTNNWYSFLQNTKSRDFGVPTCCLLILWLWTGIDLNIWWAYFLSFGAFFGAMTSYWGWVNKFLPVEDKKKEYWWNWVLTGFGYSLALLPWAIATQDWIGFAIRAGVLTTVFALWKTFTGNAVVSEVGAGVITALSTLLVLIGLKKKK